MNIPQGVTAISPGDTERVARDAAADGWAVYVLNDAIAERDSFFAAVTDALPLDPPLLSARSWDALGDSLWGGLASQPHRRVLIIWPNANVMRERAAKDHAVALSVFADVAAGLLDAAATGGDTTELSIMLG